MRSHHDVFILDSTVSSYSLFLDHVFQLHYDHYTCTSKIVTVKLLGVLQ